MPGRTGQEVPAVLMAGETVLPQGDFQNILKAFGTMANMAYKPAAASYNVNVINNAARDTGVSTSFDAGELTIAIEKKVGDAIGKGRLDASFNQREVRNSGRRVTTA